MKMGLRAVAVAALTMVLAFLAGCGREQAASTQQPSSSGKLSGLVGIAMPTKSSERWIADGNNMVAQFKAKGLQTDLQYGQDDVQQQVSQIENMITKGAKVLVIAAIDGTALTDVLQQAKDAGIKVVSYDRLIRETPNVDYYATFDNEHVGELQAGYIVDKLGLKSGKQGPFSIELFAGSPDDNNSSYFFKGAMNVLQPYMDKGQLQVKSGQTKFNQVTTQQWSGDKAQDRMENLLSKSYSSSDVDAVLSPYDGMSIGILSALKNVGYGSASKPFPVVTGQDAEVASVKSILAGEQSETIYKDTRKLAATAVGMATAMLTGKTPTVNDTKSYDNGEKVVPSELLQPVSVTKDDVQKVLVDSGYIKESDLK